MGVIVKESIKQSGIRLALAVVGAIATMFVYPLNSELYGILGYVINTSVLLMPITMIGLGQASIRFFPEHNKDIQDRTRFFIFLGRLFLVNALVLGILFFFLKDYAIAFSRNPDQDYSKYINYTLVGAIFFGLSQFLVQYLSNYKVVSLPIVWQNIYRFGMPLAFILVFFNWLSIDRSILLILACLIFGSMMLLMLSLSEKGKTEKRALKADAKPFNKSVFYNFYFWAFASSIGSIIAFKIDVFMIGSMLDFKVTGDYLIAMFMTNVIAYPIQSVLAISTPIIAQAWKDKNLDLISDIYIKGSKNLVFIGAAILITILIAIQCFALVLPKWQALKYIQIIVFIIGISKLFDMMSSVNGMIIQYSKWYRYNTYFILMLTVSNVILNYFLIDSMGITGAALATMISLSLFNILKCAFLYVKIGIHPYAKSTVFFFLCTVALMIVIMYCDAQLEGIRSILISSILAAIFLFVSLFRTNFAPDSKQLILNFINKIIK